MVEFAGLVDPQTDPVKVILNVIVEGTKILFSILMISFHLQICCKRRVVKKRRTFVSTRSISKVEQSSTASKEISQSLQPAIDVTKKLVEACPKPKSINKSKSSSKKKKLVEKEKSKEKRRKEKMPMTVGDLFKKKKEDVTQAEDADSDEEVKPDIIPMKKVRLLGNLDNIMKEKRIEIEKEIEEMKSTHAMDNDPQMSPVSNLGLHVKIAEEKCKLYETNDDPTLDDEIDDAAI